MHDLLIVFKSLSGCQLIKCSSSITLKTVIDGRAPEYLITRWDSIQFEQKYYTAYRSPEPKQWENILLFFHKKLNALNLEPTTSFSLMKTTLTNSAASNYTVDNFKVKKVFWFLKFPWVLNIIVNWFPFLLINSHSFLTPLNFLNL